MISIVFLLSRKLYKFYFIIFLMYKYSRFYSTQFEILIKFEFYWVCTYNSCNR